MRVAAVLLLAGAALAAEAVDFQREVRPILESSCIKCHGADRVVAEVRLDTREHAAPWIEPGRAADSGLYQTLLLPDDHRKAMPIRDRDRLSAEQVALLARWIDEGAGWPAGATLGVVEKIDPVQALAVLQRICLGCHAGSDAAGGRRLDRRADALAAGLVPYDAAAGAVGRVLAGRPGHPQARALTPGDVPVLRAWIAQGAVWPDG